MDQRLKIWWQETLKLRNNFPPWIAFVQEGEKNGIPNNSKKYWNRAYNKRLKKLELLSLKQKRKNN